MFTLMIVWIILTIGGLRELPKLRVTSSAQVAPDLVAYSPASDGVGRIALLNTLRIVVTMRTGSKSPSSGGFRIAMEGPSPSDLT